MVIEDTGARGSLLVGGRLQRFPSRAVRSRWLPL